MSRESGIKKGETSAGVSTSTGLDSRAPSKGGVTQDKDDYLSGVKSSTREAEESIDKLRASLQKIHAIDIVGFSGAHLMMDLMGEGKDLAAIMIQRVFRGHLGRMERDFHIDEVPHLIHVKGE